MAEATDTDTGFFAVPFFAASFAPFFPDFAATAMAGFGATDFETALDTAWTGFDFGASWTAGFFAEEPLEILETTAGFATTALFTGARFADWAAGTAVFAFALTGAGDF